MTKIRRKHWQVREKRVRYCHARTPYFTYILTVALILAIQGAQRTSSGRGMRSIRYGPSRKREEHSRINPHREGMIAFVTKVVRLSYIMRCIDASSTHSSLEGQRVTALRAKFS